MKNRYGPFARSLPARIRARRLWLVVVACAAVGGGIGLIVGLAASDRRSPLAAPSAQLVARPVGSLGAPIQGAAVAATGHNDVTLLGGLDARAQPTAQVQSLSAGRVLAGGNLPSPLHAAAAAFMDGSVYLFGGTGEASSDRILRIDPASGQSTEVGRLAQATSEHGAAVIAGTVYLVGGYSGTQPLDSIVAWRPGDQPRVVGHLPTPVRYPAVTSFDGRVFVAGGTTPSGSSRAVFEFDPQSGQVKRAATLPHPVTHAAAAALGPSLYVIGGTDQVTGPPSDSVFSIDPQTGAVSAAGRLATPVSDAGAAALPGGILVAGGRGAVGPRSEVTELVPRAGNSPDAGATQSEWLAPGSDPSVLAGNVLIADKANNRLVEVTPTGQLVWLFPGPGDLAPGETFAVPDDAFYGPDGRSIIATQEDDFVVSVIDPLARRITYRYGTPGEPGSGPNHLHNPDDALLAPDGTIFSADIVNCRLVAIHPPAHEVDHQLGGRCRHAPPAGFGSPNGAFPMANGDTVVTEINGDWADVIDPSGKLVSQTHVPGFSYPSDTNEVRPGQFLSVDYVKPGAAEIFDAQGNVLWRYAPTGPDALDHPSLALGLPNGDVLLNDDSNHRVIVIDPRMNRVVWQYGHTGEPGRAPGYLSVPDGVDLAPPNSLLERFRDQMRVPGGPPPR